MHLQGEGGGERHEAGKGGGPVILLIDSYDSFSYNLYQLIGEIEPDIRVIRNDEFTVEAVSYTHLRRRFPAMPSALCR